MPLCGFMLLGGGILTVYCNCVPRFGRRMPLCGFMLLGGGILTVYCNCVPRFGRRMPLCGFMLLGGGCCLSIVGLPRRDDLARLRMLLGLVGEY